DRLVHLRLDPLLQKELSLFQKLLDVRAQLPRLRIDDLEFLLDAEREGWGGAGSHPRLDRHSRDGPTLWAGGPGAPFAARRPRAGGGGRGPAWRWRKTAPSASARSARGPFGPARPATSRRAPRPTRSCPAPPTRDRHPAPGSRSRWRRARLR